MVENRLKECCMHCNNISIHTKTLDFNDNRFVTIFCNHEQICGMYAKEENQAKNGASAE